MLLPRSFQLTTTTNFGLITVCRLISGDVVAMVVASPGPNGGTIRSRRGHEAGGVQCLPWATGALGEWSNLSSGCDELLLRPAVSAHFRALSSRCLWPWRWPLLSRLLSSNLTGCVRKWSRGRTTAGSLSGAAATVCRRPPAPTGFGSRRADQPELVRSLAANTKRHRPAHRQSTPTAGPAPATTFARSGNAPGGPSTHASPSL